MPRRSIAITTSEDTDEHDESASRNGGAVSPIAQNPFRVLNSNNNSDNVDDDHDQERIPERASLTRRAGSARLSLVSDHGLALHAVPCASVRDTALLIVCNVLGAACLAMPQAFDRAGLCMGILAVLVFAAVSLLSSYILSVACEYSQVYSQAQLFCKCLVGLGPNFLEDEEVGVFENLEERRHQEQEQPSNQHGEEQNAPQNRQQQPRTLLAAELQRDDGDSDNNDVDAAVIADDDERVMIIEQQDTATSSTNYNNSNSSICTRRDYAAALQAAVDARNQVNILVDLTFAAGYFLFVVVYARIIADCCVSISFDLHFPDFFQHRGPWLVVSSAVFLALSLRRVFQELQVVSIVGVATISFVVLSVVIRFIDYGSDGGSNSNGSSSDDQQTHNTDPRTLPGYGINYFSGPAFLSAFGTLSSAFNFQTMQPPLYQELANRSPAKMQRAVTYGLSMSTICYLLVGTCGYLLFGSDVTDSSGGNVMQNFWQYDTLMNVARAVLIVHLLMSVPLQTVTVRQCAHRAYLRYAGLHDRADDPEEIFKVPMLNLAAETCVTVLAAVLVAGFVKSVGDVVAIAGALGGSLSLMIIPGICGMAVFHELLERSAAMDHNNELRGRRRRGRRNNNTNNNSDAVAANDDASSSVNESYAIVDGDSGASDDDGDDEDDLFGYCGWGIPHSLIALESNNLTGFTRWRPSNYQMYYLSASMIALGVLCTVGGLWSTLADGL